MQLTCPKAALRVAALHYTAESVCTTQPCMLLLQMVVRSPFLLGLTHQTLTTRIQALRAALPSADVQRMAQYSPSLLEVMHQDYPSSAVMCCICLLSSTPSDAVVLAALKTTCVKGMGSIST